MKTLTNDVFSRIAAVGLLLVAINANAVPIAYDESVSGDLAIFGPQNLALGSGANTVTGTITWSNNASVADDFDSFDFTLSAGQTLTSIVIDIALQSVGSGIWNNVGWALNASSFQGVAIPSSGLSLFGSALPLGAGTYSFNQASASGLLATGDWRRAAYTVTMNVVSVPEPGTIGLLTLGLSVLAFTRRRRLR